MLTREPLNLAEDPVDRIAAIALELPLAKIFLFFRNKIRLYDSRVPSHSGAYR
jgi:hypothetical protein